MLIIHLLFHASLYKIKLGINVLYNMTCVECYDFNSCSDSKAALLTIIRYFYLLNYHIGYQ